MGYLGIAIVALTLLFISKIWQVCRILLWRPYSVTKCFQKQGIFGPPYSLLSGSLHEIKKLKKAARGTVLNTNSHDITQRVLPHYHRWSSQYGETFLYWYGTQPRICIPDPELAKHILSNKFGFYTKIQLRPSVATMAGNGLIRVNGPDWVKHRRIVNPAFSVDKLKAMIKRMAACTLSMLDGWKILAVEAEDQCKKIEVNGEFQKLAADIIAHIAFGSSYFQGKEAFKAQRELQQYCIASITDIFIPGSQYLPTPSNLRLWNLDRKLKNSLRSIIESRLKSQASKSSDSCQPEDDLLGLLIGNTDTTKTKVGPKLNMDEIMEECKTFFFAGHETTSNLLTWTVYLLSLHHEWQESLRQEVLKECGVENPDADMLGRLKLVNMVLLETLRLYCPVVALYRKATEDMKLGELMIPKNTCISIPIVKLHRMKKYWGEDANEFNPLRFMNGISKAAKHPNALLAFAVGPRSCIGQNFAMLEAKTVIVLLLQRFSFSLSPDYKHVPADNLTLQPQYGLPILVKPYPCAYN